MSRTKKNEKLVDEIFQPDKETGCSPWKTREEIDGWVKKYQYMKYD